MRQKIAKVHEKVERTCYIWATKKQLSVSKEEIQQMEYKFKMIKENHFKRINVWTKKKFCISLKKL